jgi:hypothetical protein
MLTTSHTLSATKIARVILQKNQKRQRVAAGCLASIGQATIRV